jgi:ketosteroid isomerase-like protein
MSRINPFDIVNHFNDAISSHDAGRLASLMTEDHVFTDVVGRKVIGKKECIEVWEEFFRQFPDYKNVFERMEIQGPLVITFGHSKCSDKRLNGPALWTATIKNNLIHEWHVYSDTTENRKLLGVPVL